MLVTVDGTSALVDHLALRLRPKKILQKRAFCVCILSVRSVSTLRLYKLVAPTGCAETEKKLMHTLTCKISPQLMRSLEGTVMHRTVHPETQTRKGEVYGTVCSSKHRKLACKGRRRVELENGTLGSEVHLLCWSTFCFWPNAQAPSSMVVACWPRLASTA